MLIFVVILFIVIIISYQAQLTPSLAGGVALIYSIIYKVIENNIIEIGLQTDPIPIFILAFIAIVEVICILKEL